MWETIKNDPLLKTITIILLGVLGFGFAFNVMFGQNAGGGMDGGEMGGSTYNLGNTLSYILHISFKLLLIAFVIILLISVIKYANKYLIRGEKIKMENNNNTYKLLGIVAAIIIGIGFIWMLFGGTGNNMNGNNMNYMMNGNYGNTMGNGATGLGISGVLSFLIKILLFISVTGLIVGLVMYISKNATKYLGLLNRSGIEKCPSCDKSIASDYKLCPYCGTNLKLNCVTCGTELKAEWRCCPNCGDERLVEKTIENVEGRNG